MGKAVARRSSMKLAKECIENTTVRNYIIKEMGKMVRNELKTLCSMESVLHSMNFEDLKCFQWEALYEELESHTPNFLSFLVSFTETRTPRCNQKALICICAAILLKYRFKRMCLVHKLIGLIYAGHSSKKVYDRLNSIGISIAYTTVTKLIESLGEHHDATVRKWRDDIISRLTF